MSCDLKATNERAHAVGNNKNTIKTYILKKLYVKLNV